MRQILLTVQFVITPAQPAQLLVQRIVAHARAIHQVVEPRAETSVHVI